MRKLTGDGAYSYETKVIVLKTHISVQSQPLLHEEDYNRAVAETDAAHKRFEQGEITCEQCVKEYLDILQRYGRKATDSLRRKGEQSIPG